MGGNFDDGRQLENCERRMLPSVPLVLPYLEIEVKKHTIRKYGLEDQPHVYNQSRELRRNMLPSVSLVYLGIGVPKQSLRNYGLANDCIGRIQKIENCEDRRCLLV